MKNTSTSRKLSAKKQQQNTEEEQKEYIFKLIQVNTLLHLQIVQKKIDYISDRIINKKQNDSDIVQHQQLFNRLAMLEKQCEILQLKLKINEQNYYKQQLNQQIMKQQMTLKRYNDPLFQDKLMDDEMDLVAKKSQAINLYNQQQNIIKEILVNQKQIEDDKESIEQINQQIQENLKLQKQKQELIFKEQQTNVKLRQQLNKLKNQNCIEDYQDLLNDVQNNKHIISLSKQLIKGKKQSPKDAEIKYVHFNIYKEKQKIPANDNKSITKVKNALSRNKKRQEYSIQKQQNIDFKEEPGKAEINSDHITNNSSHFQTLMSSAQKYSENTFSSQQNAEEVADNSLTNKMSEIDNLITDNCIALDTPAVDINRYPDEEFNGISQQNEALSQQIPSDPSQNVEVKVREESQIGFVQSDDPTSEFDSSPTASGASDDFDE